MAKSSGLTAAEGGRKDLFVQVQLMIHGFCHFWEVSWCVKNDVEMFDDAFYDMFTSWELGGFCLVILVWVPKLVKNNGTFSKSRSMRMASNIHRTFLYVASRSTRGLWICDLYYRLSYWCVLRRVAGRVAGGCWDDDITSDDWDHSIIPYV